MEDELKKAHFTSQEKYVYYLLSVASGAIALSLYRTKDSKIDLYQIPLALAVICWGLSFYFGIKHIQIISRMVMQNINLFQAKRGEFDFINLDRTEIANKISKQIEDKDLSARKLYQNQFRCLIAGAILFIIWHVIEMSLKN